MTVDDPLLTSATFTNGTHPGDYGRPVPHHTMLFTYNGEHYSSRDHGAMSPSVFERHKRLFCFNRRDEASL